MVIDGINYSIIDTKEKITVADSFVLRSNKIGGGNGEAKLYLGNDNSETRDFFGSSGFNIKCFLLKKDLLSFLKECEIEYKNPEQPYRNKLKLPVLWGERVGKINRLSNVLWFDLREQTQIEGVRVYAKSDSSEYELIRELSLPNISYLSVIKLQSDEGNLVYYFRLFVDYFGEAQHPSILQTELTNIQGEALLESEDKYQLVKARSGQGKYRESLLKECPFCPFTLVSDDRLLIASHIKPWALSSDVEKMDPKNGFMFTPTYDFLFDRGFISFSDDKKLLVSPWLSKVTCSKLSIINNKIITMLPVIGREQYLDYHRNNILKD